MENDEGGAQMHLLTIREAAAVLRVTPETLRQWRRRLVGPRFLRVASSGPRATLYDARDITAWCQSRKSEAHRP